MATVSGYLKYDGTRSAAPSTSLPGIPNVPVVLQNTTTNKMLAVLTDANGMFTFTNVPNGSYRIVEAYQTSAVPTPGNFLNAAASTPISGHFPPISYVRNPPASATNLDGITPTTLLITVSGSDVTNQYILNGPVKYTPIHTLLDSGVTILPGNLITAANNGTFGSFSQGTAANTGANPNPYTNIGSGLAYVLPNPAGVTPGGGQYTIQNIMNNATATIQQTWWRIADHTSGDETGRMMVINGSNPGQVLFHQIVTVKPNTFYLMSSWILNLAKSSALANPRLGVQVLGSDGQVLYNATLGTLIPTNSALPEWKQIGTMINSQNNTSLTIQFISMGPETTGNDYAIDDIALNEVQIVAYTPQKAANFTAVHVGDIVTYTITLANTGENPLQNVTLQDAVPEGFTLIPGTVAINGTSAPSADPNTGFPVPDITGGSQLTVTFQAMANYVPTANPTLNRAQVSYAYSPVTGGIPSTFTRVSNDASVAIAAASADIAVSKTAGANTVPTSGSITYTLTATNNGPDIARNVTITDTPPTDLLTPQYSADQGNTWQTWNGSYVISSLAPGNSQTLLIRGNVRSSASGVLTNAATISSLTTDPNTGNNSSTAITSVSNQADLSITKTGDSSPVLAGNTLTYTLRVHNGGPDTAQSILINDVLPENFHGPVYSADNGTTWHTWTGTYTLSTLPAGADAVILIRGTVSTSAIHDFINTATVSSTTPDPNTANNSDTVITPINNSADISISKTPDQNHVPAGEVLTYTLTARNNGPFTSRDILLIDSVPADLLAPEYSTDGGLTWQPWPGLYAYGTLEAGTEASILIRGTVSPTAAGSIKNTASLVSSTPDPDISNNTTVVMTPINTSADLTVSKTTDVSPVQAGNTLTYTLSAVNNGPNAAEHVTLTDEIPPNLLTPQYSADGGLTWLPWTGTFSAGSLAAGTGTSILLRGTVDPAATGLIKNTMTAASSTPDPNPDNNSDTTVTPINTSADLAITKTPDQSSIQAGTMITYTLTAANNGPNNAQEVTLTDTIPAALLAPEYSTDGGITWLPWSGTYPLGTMTAGTNTTILIRGMLDPAASDLLTNTAEISSSTPDPNSTNNSSTVTIPITRIADLTITKTADQSEVPAGSVITYTLTAQNRGPNNADTVTIFDNIPANLMNPQYSTDNGTTWLPWRNGYTVNGLEAGASAQILVRGTVSSTATGVVANSAAVSSPTPDPDTGNNSDTVITPITTTADLTMTKTADPSTVQAGDTLTYTLTALNNGPNIARDVTIFDNVPTNLLDTQYSIDGGITWRSWRGGYTLASLNPGENMTILIRGTVNNNTTGILTNTATVTSPTPDPAADNNSDAVITPITTQADLSITKTSTQNSVPAGNQIIYTLTLGNSGPNPAQNVILTDFVPADLLNPEYSIDGGSTWLPWDGTYQAGIIPANSEKTLLLRGTVNSSATGDLVNTANISSSTPDPNTGNNSTMVTTPITTAADLLITKTGPQGAIQTGDLITYTLAATNNGPNNAQDVQIVEDIPDGLLTPEYSIDGGNTWLPLNGVLTLNTVPVGATIPILIRGTLSDTAGSTLTNTAAITSTTVDPDNSNNGSTVTNPIEETADPDPAVDLSITKTACPKVVAKYGYVTYTIIVSNHSAGEANDVQLTDILPPEILNAAYSEDGGYTWYGWNDQLLLGTLPGKTSVTIRIRGIVSRCADGEITNAAQVTTSTPENTPENNYAQATVQLRHGDCCGS